MSILFDYCLIIKQPDVNKAPYCRIKGTMANSNAKTESIKIFQLGYVSTESDSFSSQELVELLNQARSLNEKKDITGLLLYREGSFYQVLEGNSDAVTSTFQSIKKDPRHKNIRMLFSSDTDEREFADWRMGFLNLNDKDLEVLSGYSDFLNWDAEPQEFLENLSRGKRLALMFRTML